MWKERKNTTEIQQHKAHACWEKITTTLQKKQQNTTQLKIQKTKTQQHKAHECGDKDHNNTSKKATEHNTTKNTKKTKTQQHNNTTTQLKEQKNQNTTTQQHKAHGACGELHATSLLIPHVRADQASLTCDIVS